MAEPEDNLARLIQRDNIFAPPDPIGGMGPTFKSRTEAYDPYAIEPRAGGVNIPDPVDPIDVRGIMDKLYQPKDDMNQRFMELINQMPQREAPSFGRKLVASLSSNIPMADHILNEPFNRNMSDWKGKADVLSSAAMMESRSNRDQANAALTEISRQVAANRVAMETAKSNQIFATKIAELEQRSADAEARYNIAMERLQLDRDSRAAQLELQQARLDAMTAKFEAELARRDQEIANLAKYRDAMAAAATSRAASDAERTARGGGVEPVSEESIITDPEGNVIERRSTTRQRGAPAPTTNKTVRMLSPDGKKSYQVPANQVERAKTQYKMTVAPEQPK